MSDISFFQRYSGTENHATNNTMLMLRHVQQHSFARFERILADFIGDENAPRIGLRFAQQEKVGTAIPDAVIEQEPFHFYVESKVGGAPLDPGQLANHMREIAGKHGKNEAFLMGLSRDPWPGSEGMSDAVAETGVRFLSKTYGELLDVVQGICAGHEDLDAIVEDYGDFLGNLGLLPSHERTMVAFPCGNTAQDNVETGVYYQPDYRNRKQDRARILGVYRDKCISHIGRLAAVAVCRTEDGKLFVEKEELGTLSEAQRGAILDAIDRGRPVYGDFAAEPHRFYVVDRFKRADFVKDSKGGMAGHRYFDLEDLTGRPVDAQTPIEDIAARLKRETF